VYRLGMTESEEEKGPGTDSTGARIRRARQKRGLRQEDVAAQMNVSISLISKWESGDAPVPDRRWLALAKILHMERGARPNRDADPETNYMPALTRSYLMIALKVGTRKAAIQWSVALASRQADIGMVFPEIDVRRYEVFAALGALLAIIHVRLEDLTDESLVEALDLTIEALDRLRQLVTRAEDATVSETTVRQSTP
jgi:transcriptional regulator with XRE-family HTH domain